MRRPIAQTWTSIAVGLLGVTLLVPPAAAQDLQSVASYFEALRERGLYGVAERYGLDRRAELPADSAEFVQLSVELSRTFALHAVLAVTDDEQAFLHQRAEEVLGDDLIRERTPRAESVFLERAYRQIDRAENAWSLWKGDPEDSAARVDAAKQLATARSALLAWIAQAKESAARPSDLVSPQDLSRRELAGMAHQARLKSIDVVLLSAELAEGDAERARLLQTAEELMKPLAASAERGTTAALKAYSIRIARLTGDEPQFRLLVRQASTDRQSMSLRQSAIAELARFELDQGRFEAAAQLLVDLKKSLGEISDGLRALHVEAVIGIAGRPGADRDSLLASAQSQNQRLTGRPRRRNEQLLLLARNADQYGAQAAVLVLRGQRRFRAGRREDSITAYRAAAEASTVPAGQAELQFMVASMLVDSQEFAGAIAECDRLTRATSISSIAAKASLLSAYCRGRLWSASRESADRKAYETALVEHLRRFSAEETVGDAAWMLQELAEQDRRWAAVVDFDARIPASHARSAESATRAVRAIQRALDELQTTGAPTADGRAAEQWTDEAGRFSERLLRTGGKDLAAARRILAASQLLASVPKPDFARVLTIVDRIQPPADGSEDWQELTRNAAALRLICLTSTGQFADAAATLKQLQSVSMAELLGVLATLSEAGRSLTGMARAELGRLELETIRRIRLQREALSTAEQQLLVECEAEALFATGQCDEAARMFEQAVALNPSLLPRLAESLSMTGRKENLAKARDYWQQHESKQLQGSTRWFEARLNLARTLVALSESADCRKLIASTRIIYPELGGPELKQAFQEVEKRAAP